MNKMNIQFKYFSGPKQSELSKFLGKVKKVLDLEMPVKATQAKDQTKPTEIKL